MIHDQIITLFNRLGEIDNKEVWTKSIIKNIYLEETSSFNRKSEGVSANDNCLLIMFDRDIVVFNSIGDKKLYLSPYEFDELEEAEQELYWTIREDDIFIKGETVLDIPKNTMEELVAKHKVYTITSSDHFEHGSPTMHHWEVTCK